MANPKHDEILSQGVEVWNKWRRQHPYINPDLIREDLYGMDLSGMNLSNAQLRDGNLANAHFSNANFRGADLHNVSFCVTELNDACLSSAQLSNVDFSGADLSGADLSYSDLDGASLINANLSDANLCGARLGDANFHLAHTHNTLFIGVDLREVKGLETVEHWGPSEISISTIYQSGGKIPAVFVRGCGLSDWQLESAKLHQPELTNEEFANILYRIHDLRAHQSIQINPLFISYNHTDNPFIDEIEKYLNKKGVRFWRDIHHATAGRLEAQIDRAIRLNPTVLLVLSRHSVESDWVQHEARLVHGLL